MRRCLDRIVAFLLFAQGMIATETAKCYKLDIVQLTHFIYGAQTNTHHQTSYAL